MPSASLAGSDKHKRYSDAQKQRALEVMMANFDNLAARPRYDKAAAILQQFHQDLFPDQSPGEVQLADWWKTVDTELMEHVTARQGMILMSQFYTIMGAGLKKAEEALGGLEAQTPGEFKDLMAPLVALAKIFRESNVGQMRPVAQEKAKLLDATKLTDEDHAKIEEEIVAQLKT